MKFVATRGKIFSLKFTKYRLGAGLHPDPLGELKRFCMSLRCSTSLSRAVSVGTSMLMTLRGPIFEKS